MLAKNHICKGCFSARSVMSTYFLCNCMRISINTQGGVEQTTICIYINTNILVKLSLAEREHAAFHITQNPFLFPHLQGIIIVRECRGNSLSCLLGLPSPGVHVFPCVYFSINNSITVVLSFSYLQ